MRCFVRICLAFLPGPTSVPGKKSRTSESRPIAKIDDWFGWQSDNLVRASMNDWDDFQTDPRNFLRTIGVSRRECSAWRCTVRTPSLQLWAIPRRGEPHNELTILLSISKLAVYSCRERSLLGLLSFIFLSTFSRWSARDKEGSRQR